jgi:cell surface protein SprA
LKRNSNLGYKVLVFIALVVAIANAAARGYREPFDFDPDPQPDSPAKKPAIIDSSRNLRFPIHDNSGNPLDDNNNPHSIDINDPANVKKEIQYDPETQRYYYYEKIGNEYMRTPTYMTNEEYMKYRAQQDENEYWQRRLDALTLFNKKPDLPQMYKEGIFDRIFGNNNISVKPQGNVDITFGGSWQNIKNPALVQRAQKYGIFDFDMQMNINLLAQVGDKLKLNISNNTKATFDYQNMQKLEYTGKEDEIIKKIEAGNISFPLKSNLITGVQSLFGIKTQLQFGKLWVTGVLSQQKSQRKSMTIQGGSQTQQFAIKADNYEENKDFLLGQYFHDNYNNAVKNFPVIASLVTINKLEVWVTNRTGAVTGVRDVLAFMDLGEKNPYYQPLTDPNGTALPDNRSNRLYTELQQNPNGRSQSTATNAAVMLGLTQSQDFERTTARKLNASEFAFNPQLGYIMLNTQLNSDDVLAVAYRYTYNGKVYQVGEFAEDLPPDTSNQKVMYLKLLKGTSAHPTLPVWKLMMKNIYALGGLGVSKDNFQLNILYQDPGGGEKRYIPEGPKAGIPLLSLLNLDRLNAQNQLSPDGAFDFVDGITINTQQGKVIFPVLEPFGQDLKPAFSGAADSVILQRKYIYQALYDSTKTVALQSQQNDRYIMRGAYKSSTSSEIFLGGFNIPPGSVTVTAGGTKLVENSDYQIDYGLGKIKILNTGILNSGVPINIQYEDNSTFGFQQQNLMGARLDYYVNKKLTIGGTFMRLTERPYTQKVTFGDDPIKNTVLGADVNYQSEFPALTRALDKLPVYATTAPSFINVSGEVASLLPGHPKQINSLDPEGAVYIDDFEGTSSTYDMKLPAIAWSLSSTPYGAVNKTNQTLFPEAANDDQLSYGYNRAKLAWYFIEPTLIDGTGGVPSYVKNDPNQHYIRLVQQVDVFPNTTVTALQNALSTLDLGYYPKEKGPYNFDVNGMNADGTLTNPAGRWGGIMRPIDNTDFEASNVEYIQFWMLDPFINNPNSQGGSIYFNLGDVSEDVLKDSRLFFENGIPYPADTTQLDHTAWGNVPKFAQQITRAFNNDPAARALQDVGYDGLDDNGEKQYFINYLSSVQNRFGANSGAYSAASTDPSNDDYHYYRGADYDAQNLGVLARYKKYNNPQNNSPVTDPNATYATSETTLPETEDINKDNTLNEAESYYQYRVDLAPNMQVGQSNIVNIQTAHVKLPNGNFEDEKWYQFKIPIRDYDHKIGGIADFRSIRFMRMFLSGWQDSVILRFATLELGRNQWRNYNYSLATPGENLPQQNQSTTDFTVTSVSIEENGSRQPVPYAIPPGVQRQLTSVSNGQNVQLNEQALSLKTCTLQDGDARGVYKEVDVDMRQFSYLRMFIHAESITGSPQLRDGDVRAFIRIGSDFTSNYYEYQIPLKVTLPINGNSNTVDPVLVWPTENNIDIVLQDLVDAKLERDNNKVATYVPYQTKDSKGNTIVIVGNPNIGDAKNIMLGVLNPKKSNQNTGDDGLAKCSEVWFDEMRMAGTHDQAGYAAAGKVALQLADLGNVNLSGSMHTAGYGNIDQKIEQRFQDNFYQYNASTNLNLGKLMPRNWGVQLPLFVGYTQNVSTPKYNPYDQDVVLSDALNAAQSAAQRDSLRKAAQDFTSITSINLTNVRVTGAGDKSGAKRMPWSIKNFDLSYSYNDQFKHNPTIASDNLVTNKLGLGYTYSIKTKTYEPFKKLIKSRSKWFALVKDFNFTPLPTNFTFRTDLNRLVEETQVRNIDNGPYNIPPTFYKNFLWNRTYNLRWELTRSLSFDYSATNTSRVDEPYGSVDTKEKKDSLWNAISRFGHNTFYSQTFNSTYNVPLQKLPLTDWMSVHLGYTANYSWTSAAPEAYFLGNTIGNTQTKTFTGDLDFKKLYDKSRLLRALNQKGPGQQKGKTQLGGPNSKPTPKDSKNVKDLRTSKKGDDKSGSTGGGSTNNGGNGNDDKNPKNDKKSQDSVVAPKYDIASNPSHFTDKQLDSVVTVQDSIDRARHKAELLKKKLARKAARKLRREQGPHLNATERFIGRLLTMLTRVNVNYTENAGTVLPGYMDSTRFLGINNYTGAPGLGFAFGGQPTNTWLSQQAMAGRLSRDSLFNSQLQKQFAQNLNATATLQPFPDFRIDVTLTKTFNKSHAELYKDTGTGVFNHLDPYETGSFNISYMALKTVFKSTDNNSIIYKQFLDNRYIISNRLGTSNPYTNGLSDPTDPRYKKGYTGFSQDVLLPAFIAAYSGHSANDAPLLNYDQSQGMRSDPFKYFYPMPNWRVTYNGLSKLPFFARYVTSLVVNHSYTGTMSMNGFSSNLLYNDLYGLGFPSFIDSNSHNYVPFYTVPNVTISQAFNPLIGFDASFRNNVTGKFEIRKSKTESLGMTDYQVAETSSTEYVIGFGYRIKNLKLPISIFGVTRLKNELIFKFDLGLRDDKSSNNYLSNNIGVITSGQKVLRISPTVDYSVSPKLTLHFYYDRTQTIPYVSSSYPITTAKGGVTLRFIFAQ